MIQAPRGLFIALYVILFLLILLMIYMRRKEVAGFKERKTSVADNSLDKSHFRFVDNFIKLI